MARPEPPTPVQGCLDRIAAGDPTARADLIRLSSARVLGMTRAMLARFPGVRRWEETDDVVQNVLMRLDRALAELPLKSTRDFLAIAATNIRRELIDLARHYYGAEGGGTHHATPAARGERRDILDQPDAGENDPARIAEWSEIHSLVAELPEESREVFDLYWYHGLKQEETAKALGVSVRTVRRRLVAAKLQLAQLLGYSLSGAKKWPLPDPSSAAPSEDRDS
jgi:RNA polymerase sigma-70 factor (ECF subfamily)